MSTLLVSFRNPRIILAFIYDAFIVLVSFWGAVYLRFDSIHDPLTDNLSFNRFFFVTLLIHLASFILNGLYRGVWRFSSMFDLLRVIKASMIGTVMSLVAGFYMLRLEGVPRSLFLIHFLMLVVGLGGGRFIYRYVKDHLSQRLSSNIPGEDIKNVLIVGAGRAGEKLLRDINSTPSLNLRVIGFLDDDRFKRNALIHNVKVLGESDKIQNVVTNYNVHKIFLAIPSASGEDVKRIVSFCNKTNAEIKILPRMDQLLSNQVELSLLRNLNIEDLLGREQVTLDTVGLSEMISDKTVLITGAGGSIGSELAMQIAKFSPSLLILADSCELFMYEIEMKFRERFANTSIIPKIVDVRNALRVREVFESYRPDLVFHAAAYKHVPMMEHNPTEAIETNVKGTKVVGELALEFKVDKFVLISTDKAVNPTNVMGASKRIAEMVITELSLRSDFTKFISVRFGNVLGSNGSVIPLFRKQIEDRKNLTVTHPDIVRYFMSIPEACQLVLQAGALGDGGEIFVLDMGEPVRIVDLAREMIRLAGMEEGRDLKIVFSGLRPGEKLYEELFSEHELSEGTCHSKIKKAKFRPVDKHFHQNLSKLLSLGSLNGDAILYLIREIVPEFSHFRMSPVIEDHTH